MPFQPEKITREHVLKAIKDIDDEVVDTRPSTKFDILYEGKTYPPKDVMRLAHEYATGEYLWIPGGGEPTNKYLKALDFVIVDKGNTKFSWVQTHKEIVSYLSGKENRQVELIELLQSIGITEFNDKDANNNDFPLNEIDPFTFFCYIYKHGPLKRLKYLQNIAQNLNLTIPTDDLGIPSANAQKVWLFPFKVNRNNNEIMRLWNFFHSELSNSITDEQFKDILQIMNVGKIKITESLFYVNPEKYFPLNGPTKPYIEKIFGVNSNFNTFSEYKNVLDNLRQKTSKPFYELSYEAWLWNDKRKNQPEIAGTKEIESKVKIEIMKELELNQILFGPPGTGKTFNTINEALKIVDSKYFESHQNDRKKLTNRFKELLIKNSEENKGQIGFCTFHQSFSYEDFVEGIKPKTTETKEHKSVYYDIEPGVFKRICQLADSNNSTIKVIKDGKISWNEEQFKKASFYKLSLGEYNNPTDRPIYEYCRDNSYIAIGFGQENDFTGLSESEIIEKCEDLKLEVTAAQQMNYFIHYLKKNNYVIISNGNKYVRAIGKVVGDYEYVADSPIRYNHFRKVEWLFVDENIPIEELYERGLSQKTMYKIDESALKQDFFTNKGQQEVIEAKEDKKFVLIIDEINRGNVSSIFGELITLIEKDKRAGCDEELEVTLPYSKEPFKVPSNVYIIGTMNTADRSIEALDTALRRRFSFKEFPPKSHLIKTEGNSGKTNGIVDGIDLEELLNTINTRIEKLIDKDHRIGHSYFLKVDSKPKFIHAFKNEIIPLLEEYFFGDYGKIGLVLGSSFIEKVNNDFSFAEFTAYDTDIQSDLKEKAVFRIKPEDQWDFSKI